MSVNLYRIDCLTNMHVGNGDVNYNIVDNEVEKDPVLGVPTIHSSGIKGALRAYCEEKEMSDVCSVFGSSRYDSTDQTKSTPGSYKFLNANLIARPLRVSQGNISYINVTTVEMIDGFLKLMHNLGITKIDGLSLPEKLNLNKFSGEFLVSTDDCKGIEGFSVEKFDSNTDAFRLLNKLIGDRFGVTSTTMFKSFDLPVLARNQLDNGISNNLWYEEIVPHQSIFYFSIVTPQHGKELIFNELVQIGASASIGYGFTKVTKVV